MGEYDNLACHKKGETAQMNARTILGIITGLPALAESVEMASRALKDLAQKRSGAAGAKDDEAFQKLATAIELQAKISEQLESQFKIIQTVLDGMHKSIRLLSFAVLGAVLLAALAIILAVVK
jgi:hypothetical protein